MKADYYKGTEKILYNYNYLKANLEIKLKELHEIQLDDGVSGINYEGVSTCKTYKISQPVEDIAVLNLEMINSITQNIKKLKSKINSIEMSLSLLSDEEREIIQMKYFDSMNWPQISNKVNMSERHAQRIKNNAINKMKVGLFGIIALEEEVPIIKSM
ncbi:phage transcriptional activator, RinA family [Acetoanaerobium noterae]|uniref:Phage transcriptional activator, RinA family n=1 Tax=Acetoanaerobium noterae TaxID=745369 RepID=A0A1T5A0N9_9FIRM|nr:sigma factor-like helix-turn-helix DNA-binding protein [Acetoanaerobium noterae]SKB28425.1 phage transcriptional activator, RinA family [Acetoanaerobium noterae]